MKKCPTCQKTFDDNMRFCQTDGTPLVEATESHDPYATMVASKDEIASAIPPESPGASSASKEDDVLEIPDSDDDPMKTSVVTEAEMREITSGKDSSSTESAKSEESDYANLPSSLPKFDEPELNPPTFGSSSSSASDSPFSDASSKSKSDLPFSGSPPFSEDFSSPKQEDDKSGSPIPSPFGEKMPPSYQTPSSSPFEDPEPPKNEPFSPFNEPVNPFGQSPFESSEPQNQPVKQEWTPPSSPAGSFGEPAVGQNPPVSASAESGQSKTLAIVSLVLGALGFICCGNILCGIPAIIVGYMARSKEAENPNAYAGSNLALIGMVLGALSVITFIGLIILQVFFGALDRIL